MDLCRVSVSCVSLAVSIPMLVTFVYVKGVSNICFTEISPTIIISLASF